MKRIISLLALFGSAAIITGVFFYDRSIKENVKEEVQTQQADAEAETGESKASKTENSIIDDLPGQLSESDQAVLDAHINLLGNFDLADYGYVYPDDYCGEYQKGDKLHIVLMSLDQDTVEKYEGYVKNSNAVVFEKGEVPLVTLNQYRDELWEALQKEGIMPTCAGAEQINNKLVIEVVESDLEEAKAFVEKYIESKGTNDLPVTRIEVTSGSVAKAD